MLILRTNEDEVIDATGTPKTDSAPRVTQGNTPGENLQTIGEDRPAILPDPAVGGQNASKVQNGFSTGFEGIRARLQGFRGATLIAPGITNPVQGQVGQSNLADSLYAGVKDQLTQYRPDQASYVASFVGPITNTNQPPTYIAAMRG